MGVKGDVQQGSPDGQPHHRIFEVDFRPLVGHFPQVFVVDAKEGVDQPVSGMPFLALVPAEWTICTGPEHLMDDVPVRIGEPLKSHRLHLSVQHLTSGMLGFIPKPIHGVL